MFQACLQSSLSRLATLLCACSPPHAHTSCKNVIMDKSANLGGWGLQIGKYFCHKTMLTWRHQMLRCAKPGSAGAAAKWKPFCEAFWAWQQIHPPVLATEHDCGFTGSVWIMYIPSAAGARHTSPSLLSSCSANAWGLNFLAANVRKRKTNKKSNKINARLSFLPSLHSGSC